MSAEQAQLQGMREALLEVQAALSYTLGIRRGFKAPENDEFQALGKTFFALTICDTDLLDKVRRAL